jgi:hypothetical protein
MGRHQHPLSGERIEAAMRMLGQFQHAEEEER